MAEYLKLTEQGCGLSLGADGCSGVNAAINEEEDALSAAVISYTERTAAAKSKVSDLEDCLANLEMGTPTVTYGPTPPPSPHTAMYQPQIAYAAAGTTTPVPHTVQIPATAPW